MTKTLLISAALTSLLIVTPVFAARDNNHENGNSNRDNAVLSREAVINPSPSESASPLPSPSVSPSASPSATPSSSPSCNPLDNWFNHGAYVSCVAHEHLGGKVTSEAARSDIGKKHEDCDKDDHCSPAPSVSPSASPSASPSQSPSATPSATPPITFGAISPNFFSLDLNGGI